MKAGITFDLEGTSVDLEVQHHDAHVEAACSLGIGIDKEFALANVEHFIGGQMKKSLLISSTSLHIQSR